MVNRLFGRNSEPQLFRIIYNPIYLSPYFFPSSCLPLPLFIPLRSLTYPPSIPCLSSFPPPPTFPLTLPPFLSPSPPGKPSKYHASQPVKGPDYTVVLNPMEIRTFDVTVQYN